MEPTFTQKVEVPEPQGKMCCIGKFTWKRFLMLLGVVASVLILWQYISSPMVVTVTGTGKASVPATSATVTTTVSVNSDTAQNALLGVRTRVEGIKSILVASGIAESDISISQITSYPAALVTTGATGYQAAVQITSKTVHVSTVGDLVASLYAAGASLVAQPVLNVENQNQIESEASNMALKDAKSQVSKIALKNLKLIRKATAMYESTSDTTSTTTSKADTTTSIKNDLAATNGVFEITKSVTVSYKLW